MSLENEFMTSTAIAEVGRQTSF